MANFECHCFSLNTDSCTERAEVYRFEGCPHAPDCVINSTISDQHSLQGVCCVTAEIHDVFSLCHTLALTNWLPSA